MANDYAKKLLVMILFLFVGLKLFMNLISEFFALLLSHLNVGVTSYWSVKNTITTSTPEQWWMTRLWRR